jgi:putative MATE family efflux protein
LTSPATAQSAPVQLKRYRSLSLIKEAILGARHDLTAISIDRAIFLLAVPTVLEMAMESLLGLVDILFVAHLGAEATATVGLTEGLLVLVFAIAAGLSMGSAAVIARRIGERDKSGAAEAAVQSVLLGAIAAVVILAVCLPLAPKLLMWMGASAGILRVGSTYTRIMMSSSGIVLLLFVMNAIFRGAGDAAVAMRVLWLANLVNLCLDPCLILGLGPFPRLGVTGAAVSTALGRSAGILFQLYILLRGRSRIEINRQHLKFNFKVMAGIIKIAVNGAMQSTIATASWVIMTRLVQSFGAAATAGYTVAIRIVIFSMMPSWGLGSAAATLVGQNLGAKQPERAEQSVWRAGLFNMVFLGGLSLVFLLFAPQVVGFLNSDPEVTRVGANCLRIVSLCYVLYAYGMVIVQAFNGAGDTFTPSMINLICYWGVQLPVAFLLGWQLHLGPNGIFLAMLAAEVLLAVVSICVFKSGRWKKRAARSRS